ncbi:MAG: response regulator transcription factor [Christensenellales bacterium]
MKYKVLVIEDEEQIRDIVLKYLRSEGYEAFGAKDGIDGLAVFSEYRPHLVVLDIMMPSISGYEVLKQIRLVADTPVIMLTAKQEEGDRLHGFNLGADDYVPKPFSPRELVKRVQAVLRRTHAPMTEKQIFSAGIFKLDLAQQKLYKGAQEIEITAREFMLLKVFFENPGAVFTRQQLIDKAFGYDYDGFDRNIDSYIKNLRQKIEDDSRSPVYLTTKYGAGYAFEGGQE